MNWIDEILRSSKITFEFRELNAIGTELYLTAIIYYDNNKYILEDAYDVTFYSMNVSDIKTKHTVLWYESQKI